MKIRAIILSAILFATITGCKKGSDDPSGIVLLSGITAVNGSITENIGFKYDDNYHLVEYTDDYQNSDIKYKYDSADRLLQVDSYDTKTGYSQSIVYDYSTPGQVTVNGSYKTTPASAAVNTTSTLTLNALKQVTKATFTNSPADDYILYTYDTAGNLLTETTYVNQATTTGPATSVIYKYDNQKNPFVNTRGNMLNAFKQAMPNNMVNSAAADVGHANVTTHYSSFYYVFDANGFPATATQVATVSANTTSATATATYTYIRK